MKPIVAVVTRTELGPRVRLEACPRCDLPIRLDHVGRIDANGRPVVDRAAVALAQQVHLAFCAG